MAPNAGPLRSVQCQRTANVSREKKFIMTICAVKLCHNTSEKQKKCNNITFHRIPIDPVIADKWVKNIRLSRGEVYWKPTKNTRICSKHFKNEDKYITQGGSCRLRRNAVPVKDLHISCTGTDDQLDEDLFLNMKTIRLEIIVDLIGLL
ncbi:THAP domain-containing protein 2-like [Pieris rapae]|uniref:THAP domain-containing protein 2-like n=1 Tax=Pieris rapae TaxID=64459 RepID=UPI001E280707|nr:THAP domain-containing protein 2-like [Pieris rapae]